MLSSDIPNQDSAIRAESQGGVDAGTAKVMAGICDSRIQLWECLQDLVGGQVLVSQNSVSGWLNTVGQAVKWIGADSRRLQPTFQAASGVLNEVNDKGVASVDLPSNSEMNCEEKLLSLIEKFSSSDLISEIKEIAIKMVAAIRQENSYWNNQNIDKAKQSRSEQYGLLAVCAEKLAVELAWPLLCSQGNFPGVLLAEYLLAVLTLETGKDYQTAIYAKF